MRAGIIPAYAGSTRRALATATGGRGSSPHTRGARFRRRWRGSSARIIPAYAGSTFRPVEHVASGPDHPRIRGEHALPHHRGARRVRIIPAYAGSTFSPKDRFGSYADHPRIRGEHISWPETATRSPGSSPHTRGAPPTSCRWWRNRRIIPAYAGSTAHGFQVRERRRDHPRIRGEHKGSSCLTCPTPGSSPHTRGAQSLFEDLEQYVGIIPAYAGSTGMRRQRGQSGRDHPRIRGEHTWR